MNKKVIYMFLIFMAMMFIASPVLAGDITACKNALPGVIIDKKIPDTVHLIVLIIKVVVPILLVIFGMIDLLKGVVAAKDDEIKKGQQIFVKRLIAGALVFFIFTIVQLLISLVADKSEDSSKDQGRNITKCVNCFINGECGK